MICPSDFSLHLSGFWKDEFSVSVDCNIRAISAWFVFNDVVDPNENRRNGRSWCNYQIFNESLMKFLALLVRSEIAGEKNSP